ncbi:hypothetical protein B0H14DRAFT_1217403 [Mycena olivaceomarginata]|nr:hypothetical protein B0H14DRAFT_1217403 [Mycena olivaceomarginata]
MSPFVRDVGSILLDDGSFRELWERERGGREFSSSARDFGGAGARDGGYGRCRFAFFLHFCGRTRLGFCTRHFLVSAGFSPSAHSTRPLFSFLLTSPDGPHTTPLLSFFPPDPPHSTLHFWYYFPPPATRMRGLISFSFFLYIYIHISLPSLSPPPPPPALTDNAISLRLRPARPRPRRPRHPPLLLHPPPAAARRLRPRPARQRRDLAPPQRLRRAAAPPPRGLPRPRRRGRGVAVAWPVGAWGVRRGREQQ